MQRAHMLEARALSKRYGPITAVDGVSFTIAKGERVGLLGPNGAGKTTTLNMLTGLVRPDRGEVLLEGRALSGDTDPSKRTFGLVPQDLALYEELSAQDNLQIFGALYALSGAALARAIDAALEVVKLTDRRRDPIKTFSGGMKRRINLAAALLHDPRLILLDEPTVGVDPQSRNAIFDNIEALSARGCTILYTTHYMEEVERLCERVIIVDRGKVIADEPKAELARRMAVADRLRLELTAPPTEAQLAAVRARASVRAATADGARLTLELVDLDAAADALSALAGAGARVTHLATDRPSLESTFLALTGEQLRDS